jgi:hypothetical protein
MQSGEFDIKLAIYNFDPNQFDATGHRGVYNFNRNAWVNAQYLETIKDNAVETPKSHDSSMAIVRFTFRRFTGQVHISSDIFLVNGVWYETVGEPIYHSRYLVYVNAKTRSDIV